VAELVNSDGRNPWFVGGLGENEYLHRQKCTIFAYGTMGGPGYASNGLGGGKPAATSSRTGRETGAGVGGGTVGIGGGLG